MIRTRAAVVTASGVPPALIELELGDPRPDEVLVRVVATGVCHTDLAWAAGKLDDAFPVVLGHETSGVVEEVGSAVTSVRPGDRVVIGLTHHCGRCRDCEEGHPMLCSERTQLPPRISAAGSPIVQGFGVGGFAELVLVRESSCVVIPDGVPTEIAAVVGCAVATGLGAVFNIAKVTPGSRVLVIGGGGIGSCVVMGAVLSGAEQIVVVEPSVERGERLRSLGATDVVVPGAAAANLAGDGFDFTFESVGSIAAMEDAIELARRGGTITLIGAPAPDARLSLNALGFVVSQKRLLGCVTGDVSPQSDFDRYFRLYLRGRLDLESLVGAKVSLNDIAVPFGEIAAHGGRTLVLP